MGNEPEEETAPEAVSPEHNSSSSPDEAIMPTPPTMADNFKQFQELFKRIAVSQDIPLEEVQEYQHKLLKILQSSSASKIALTINNTISEPAETV